MRDLMRRLVGDVKPYYASNDASHDLNHGKAVLKEAHVISKKLGLDDTQHRAALVAAAWHDAFADDRDSHHTIAYDHVLNNAHWFAERYDLDPDAVKLVALGCLEHRASWNGKLSSVVSEVVSSADRGRPSSLKHMLKRAYEFGLEKTGLDVDQAKTNACFHMHEKYGREGYATYPDCYRGIYGDELETLHAAIDKLDVSVPAYDRVVG